MSAPTTTTASQQLWTQLGELRKKVDDLDDQVCHGNPKDCWTALEKFLEDCLSFESRKPPSHFDHSVEVSHNKQDGKEPYEELQTSVDDAHTRLMDIEKKLKDVKKSMSVHIKLCQTYKKKCAKKWGDK